MVPIKYFIFGILILHLKSLPLVYSFRGFKILSKAWLKTNDDRKVKKDLFKVNEGSHSVFLDDVWIVIIIDI